MMKRLLLTTFISLSFLAQGQDEGLRVYLSDKGSSLAILDNPELFLSQEALERRSAQGISIDKYDLPLAPEYLKEVRRLGGKIEAKSKWLNYIYVSGIAEEDLLKIPFVKKIEVPKTYKSNLAGTSGNFDYGLGRSQIELISGHLLHQEGFTGRGVSIAVIDAGFRGTLVAPVLDSLRQSGRLRGSYNFITKDTNVYTGQGSHGASVLSVMAALETGAFVGTAPHADYWLLTSENIGSETPIEMDHWLMAAEFADSVGAHVINTSLGYTTFDDPSDDHSYADMDGNTTVVTRAADWAASRGIVVVASAGNEGAGSWQFIGAPADGDSVLAVGATDATGTYVGFSSRGPSFDSRVKPDVSAMGAGTVLINSQGQVQSGFGTSFSSPCIAGMAACLVQADPTLHGEEIAWQIRRSAHLFGNANNTLGFGIPDFHQAWQVGLDESSTVVNLNIYPNPCKDRLFIHGDFQVNESLDIRIQDQSGKLVYTADKLWQRQALLLDLSILEPGMYLLSVNGQQQKLLVQ